MKAVLGRGERSEEGSPSPKIGGEGYSPPKRLFAYRISVWGLPLTQKRLHVQTPPVLVAEAFFVGAGGMGSETREIVMAFSREFGETESPPRWDMIMVRCLGRWLIGPGFFV